MIEELIEFLPALYLVGPRGVGKTTTALRHARSVLRLDDPGQARAVRADPNSAIRDLLEPVLIDEWQYVPEVLGAVKRAVDADSRPGRFIVAGSAQAARSMISWPGTGRLTRVTQYGMTIREQRDALGRPTLVDQVHTGTGEFSVPPDAPDLKGYVELALMSGFPQAALQLPQGPRQAWLSSYVDQLVARDIPTIERGRDPQRISAYIKALALNSAGTATDRTLYESAGIDKRTARAYESLLEDLFVVETVSSWHTNQLKRLARSGKRYLIDPGLMAAAADADAAVFMRSGDLLGRLLDTFVASQIRPEVDDALTRTTLHHLRQLDGRHEIDLIVEATHRGLVGIEVKADSGVSRSDARHLIWLRDHIGEHFAGGVVLHTGQHAYRLDHRVYAVPICALWG